MSQQAVTSQVKPDQDNSRREETSDENARIWTRHVPPGDGRRGRTADQRRPGDPEHRPGGGDRRDGRNRLLQHRRALPQGVHGLGEPRGPRRNREPYGTDPGRYRLHGSQHAGPGAPVHRLRHARRRLERARAADRRPRLADRVLPALRLRPRRLRGVVRKRSSTCLCAYFASSPSPGRATSGRR